MKPSGLGRKAGIICFWLVLWQLISIAVHNSIVLVGPAEVAGALVSQISTVEFWRTIGLTFGKICSGFSGAFLAGILVGSAACRFPFFKGFTGTSHGSGQIGTRSFLRHTGTDLDRL